MGGGGKAGEMITRCPCLRKIVNTEERKEDHPRYVSAGVLRGFCQSIPYTARGECGGHDRSIKIGFWVVE